MNDDIRTVRPLLFLKAVIKKQVWIAGYTKRDGTVVPGHYHMVNVSTDHDEHKAVAGKGNYTEQQAHKKLSKKQWWQDMPHDHKVGHILKEATAIQDLASQTSRINTLKKKLLAGQSPLPNEWKAFHGAPAAKKQAVVAELKAAGKEALFAEHYGKYLTGAPKEAPQAAAEPSPKAEPQHEAPKAAEPEKKPEPPKAAEEPKKPDTLEGKIIAGHKLTDAEMKEFDSLSNAQQESILKMIGDPAKEDDFGKQWFDWSAKQHKPAFAPKPAAGPDAKHAAILEKIAQAQAKLPEGHHITPGMKKKLDAIAHALKTGNEKDILTHGYQTHTYGKQAAKLANEALAAMGSKHTVTPGQAMGSHPGLKDEAEGEKKQEPVQADDGPHEGDTKEGADGTLVLKDGHWVKQGGDEPTAEAPKAAEPAAAADALAMPDFSGGKNDDPKFVEYYQKVAQKVIDHAKAGNASVLEDMKADGLKPKNGKVGNTWKGKTANSKKLLALYDAALAHAKGEIPAMESAPASMDKEIPKAVTEALLAHPEGMSPKTWDHVAKLATEGDAAGLKAFKETTKGMPSIHDWIGDVLASMGEPAAAPEAAAEPDIKDLVKQAGYDVKEKPDGSMLLAKQGSEFSTAYANKTLAENAVAKLAEKGVDAHVIGTYPYLVKVNGKAAKAAPEGMSAIHKETIDGIVADGEFDDLAPYAQALKEQGKHAAAEYALKKLAEANAAKAAAPKYPKGVNHSLADDAHAASEKGDFQTLKDIYTYAKEQGLGATAEYVQKLTLETPTPPDAKPAALTFENNPFVQGLANDAQKLLDAGDKEGLKKELNKISPTAAKDSPIGKLGQYIKDGLAYLGEPAAESSFPTTQEDHVPSNGLTDAEIGEPQGMGPAYAAQVIASAKAGDMEALKKYHASAGTVASKPAMDFLQGLMDKLAAKQNAMPEPHAEANQPKFADALGNIKKMGESGDVSALKNYAEGCLESPHPGVPELGKYALKVAAWAEKQKAGAGDNGPKEGDTKEGADGMLIFQNGRWHKMKGDEAKPKAMSPAELKKMAASVPKPKFEGHNSIKMNAAAKALKAIAETEGAAGLDKAITDSQPNGLKVVIAAGGQKFGIWKDGHGTPTENGQKLKEYALGLKAAMAGTTGSGEAAAPAAKPAPKAAPKVTGSTVTETESVDGWKQVGPQGGYNPGGTFEDANGQKWYVKFPAGGEKIAKNELLATKLYAAAGVEVPEVKLVSQGGKIGLASKIVDGAVADKSKLLEGKAPGLLNGFGADAWLANWDTVGNNPAAGKGFDNILFKPDGSAIRIDAGGALLYGGAGGKKQSFENEVTDLKTMLDASINKNTAAVFGKMSAADITASVAKVAAIPDYVIENLVNQFGPGSQAEKNRLAAKLIARKENMIGQYPGAAKAKPAAGGSGMGNYEIIQPKFEPEKLSTPPNFLNWGESGKSGPATAEYKNVANQKGVDELLQVAKSGDIGKIDSHLFPVYGADGSVTDHVTWKNHPSKWVRSYAEQMINEIRDMTKPKKVFKMLPGSAVGAINDAHPVITSPEAIAKCKKAAKYLVLGEPGIVDMESLGLTKQTYLAGTVPDTTYAEQSKKAFSKMPKAQREAVASYTAGGYGGQNGSMWAGNPTGAAKATTEAIHTFGYEIKAGTTLSRRISLSGKDLTDIVGTFNGNEQSGGAVGKVLQELAIGSSSTDHDFWSGNVQLKITVGPGCKGLWVGYGSKPGYGMEHAESSSGGHEREIIFPPNYRLLVNKVKKSYGKKDADGYGGTKSEYVVEVLLLPTQE